MQKAEALIQEARDSLNGLFRELKILIEYYYMKIFGQKSL
jgi:hypothetical protein